MCAILSRGKAGWRFARVWLRSHKDISEWAGVAWLGGCLVGGNFFSKIYPMHPQPNEVKRESRLSGGGCKYKTRLDEGNGWVRAVRR